MLVWDLEFGSLREYQTAVAKRRIESGRAQALDGTPLRHPITHHQVRAGVVPAPEFLDEKETGPKRPVSQRKKRQAARQAETQEPKPSTRQRYATKVLEADRPVDDGLIASETAGDSE